MLDYLIPSIFQPYLHLSMRLGEGTGAVLAMSLVEASARIPAEMTTFDETGISCKEEKEKEYEDISDPSR